MDWLPHILYPIARWVHIVATTLIVGGTLFYELVVPIAIDELKKEQQLYVFARARWVFRWVVYIGAVLLILSGVVSAVRMWTSYTEYYPPSLPVAILHIGLGVAGIVIALVLCTGGRPPAKPVHWMRINLMVLLVAIFAASMARHVRLTLRERDEYVSRQARELEKRQQRPLPVSPPPAVSRPATTQR